MASGALLSPFLRYQPRGETTHEMVQSVFGKKRMNRPLPFVDDGEDDEITDHDIHEILEDIRNRPRALEVIQMRQCLLEAIRSRRLQSEEETISTKARPPPPPSGVVKITIDADKDALIPARTDLRQISSENVKINKERIFVMANFLIELLSATFDQLSSVHKPRYALIAMLMSFVTSIICIIELAYKAGKERVVWRQGSKLSWFYYPSPSNKHFGSFPEIIGLICAILQSISSAMVYTFYTQHADYPIKISFWSIVFATCLLCSKFMQKPDQNNTFRED